jgi:hypothetical protein
MSRPATSSELVRQALVRKLAERRGHAHDNLEAAQAWDQFFAFVRRHGSDAFQYPACSNGRLHYPAELPARTMDVLGRMGGYPRVAHVIDAGSRDNVHWVRKEFLELYDYAAETHDLLGPGREEASRLLSQVEGWKLKDGDASN